MSEPTMELYILEPIESVRHAYDPWQVAGTARLMVVRASGPEAARHAAVELASDAGDREPHVWLDAAVTSCSRLQDDGEPGVIVVEVVP